MLSRAVRQRSRALSKHGASPHTPYWGKRGRRTIPDWRECGSWQSGMRSCGGLPEWLECKRWKAGMRSRKPACQLANALSFCAFPCPASCGKHTRMIGAAEAGRPYVRKKPICRGAYVRPFSANPAPLLLRHPIIDSKMGVWGLAPMFTFCPCLSLMQPSFCPRKRAARLHRSFIALL